jgi:EAL domain-containing protein (putative c-di-GMP-specific phosphodiesterase class I)/GGDEF domain-containing protein
MKSRATASSSIRLEAQFIDALRKELLTPEARKGMSAVVRVRVNAHMATISRFGEHNAKVGLLEPAGHRLRRSLRSSDLVATAQPGIFLILLKDLNSEDNLATICEGIIRAGKRPFQIVSKQVYSGFTIGAAIISEDDIDAVSLVNRVTATMYQHNRYGDGGFELFPDELVEDPSDPRAMESCISNALRTDLFELDFQPQYRRDGTLMGARAMSRMYTPGGQRLKGEEFLPGLEDRELLLQVSERFLGQVCFQAGDWLRRGIPIPSLSFVVADPHFLQKDFSKTVSILLEDAGIPGFLLELELLESTILSEFETAKQTLTDLAGLGVRFALRGVNMGSSLTSCLPRLPIATLQLSCSPKAIPSLSSAFLLRAVISQGHRLGLRVTSRDIHCMEQMETLRASGCDGFQGPLLSEPLRKNKMEEILLAWNSHLREAV